MKNINNLIKSLKLRWGDLFLLTGFICLLFFLIYGHLYMRYPNPNGVAFKIWAFIPLFVIAVLSWGVYIFLEHKRGNGPNYNISFIFIALAIVGVVGILIQPATFQETVVVRLVNDINKEIYGNGLQVGELVDAPLSPMTISPIHYTFFSLDIILILAFIYIGVFIFPKRFNTINFVKYFSYAIFIFLFVLIIYGYIAQFNEYVLFVKALFTGKGDLAELGIKSFVVHRNAYGMAMMIGIILAFICHSLDKKWWNYLLAGIFFTNLLFSYSKTSILISVILVLIYVTYRLIVTYQNNQKRNLILLICEGFTVFSVVLVVIITLFSKGKILAPLYNILTSTNTLESRSFIWANCMQLLRSKPLYFIFGRGFGLVNEMLLPMNLANGDNVFATHSGYINLLAEGGIVYLLAYDLFIGYSIYIIVKTYKKAPPTVIAISLGIIAFTFYSIIETNHYFVYAFMFLIMVLYHSTNSEIKKEDQLA